MQVWRCRLRIAMRKWQLRWVWSWSEGLSVLGSLSVDCGGLTSAWINQAGFCALTVASKLPSAELYQRWVLPESAERMTDMLPSSAMFIILSTRSSVCLEAFHQLSWPKTSCCLQLPSVKLLHESAGGCCTECRTASPVPADSSSAEDLVVGLSAEVGNDTLASHAGPL